MFYYENDDIIPPYLPGEVHNNFFNAGHSTQTQLLSSLIQVINKKNKCLNPFSLLYIITSQRERLCVLLLLMTNPNSVQKCKDYYKIEKEKKGAFRELNSGPLAP